MTTAAKGGWKRPTTRSHTTRKGYRNNIREQKDRCCITPSPKQSIANYPRVSSHLHAHKMRSIHRTHQNSIRKQVVWGIPLETFTASNQNRVSILAKEGLPKCHPDTFSGDAAMSYPWKRSFKEMDYHRNRHSGNSAATLTDLWAELGRFLSNAAVLIQTLIERLSASNSERRRQTPKTSKPVRWRGPGNLFSRVRQSTCDDGCRMFFHMCPGTCIFAAMTLSASVTNLVGANTKMERNGQKRTRSLWINNYPSKDVKSA